MNSANAAEYNRKKFGWKKREAKAQELDTEGPR